MKPEFDKYLKPIVVIIIIFLGFFLYTKITGPIPFFINSVSTTKADFFNVSGIGEATAVPDVGIVNVGITQTAATVNQAQSKTNEIASKVIADIKKLGIDEKNIKTTSYSVTPNYGQTAEPQVQNMMYPLPPTTRANAIVNYTVTQNLQAEVKPIEKANKVIDTATANGANIIGQVSFSFSDNLKTQLENKARAEAIKKAKEKAQNLSNLSGIRLGKLVNVTESNEARPWPMTAMGSGKTTDQAQSPTNVTPGESTISITVTLSYETF